MMESLDKINKTWDNWLKDKNEQNIRMYRTLRRKSSLLKKQEKFVSLV